jgi:DNA primase
MPYKKKFNRRKLPTPREYYFEIEKIRLRIGDNGWALAICPFHDDCRPSLSINLNNGGFICHACDVSGGNVLDYHMERHKLSFKEAAIELGAWEV